MANYSWDSTPVIHKVKLPNGNTYFLKDLDAREWIEWADGIIETLESSVRFIGVTTDALTDGDTTHNPVTIKGETNKVTATTGDMVTTEASGSNPAREFIWNGNITTPCWQEIGSTGALKAFAFADKGKVTVPQKTVSFGTHTKDNVLGEATTFTNSTSSVSFAAHTTATVLKSDVTATVPKPSYTTRYLTASLSGGSVTPTTGDAITALGSPTTDKAVKSYPGTSKKLTTAAVTAGTAASWSASVSNEELSFTWSANTPTAIGSSYVATGAVASSDTQGASVLTGLGTATTFDAVKSYSPTTGSFVTEVSHTNPAITLTENSSTSTGAIQYIKSASTSGTNAVTFATSGKTADAITALGAATAAAQTITVGTNDKVSAITALGAGTVAASTNLEVTPN